MVDSLVSEVQRHEVLQPAASSGPRVGPYTFESIDGPRIKDPINLAFVDMNGGLSRVVDIVKTLGFSFDWGVGDQYFAEPDGDSRHRHMQDRNLATSPIGIHGRDHMRIYGLYPIAPSTVTVVASVHRERWPRVGWFLRRPCDAVESFDAPRAKIVDRLAALGFRVDLIDFANCNPLPQCDGKMPRSDGQVAMIREPGP